MKLTNEDKFAASVAMLQGDSFVRGRVIMFPFEGKYCVMQMIGPADKCKKIETASWCRTVEKFEEYIGG